MHRLSDAGVQVNIGPRLNSMLTIKGTPAKSMAIEYGALPSLAAN
jgi:hypothetical protein